MYLLCVVCVRLCVRACVRACVSACVCACVVYVFSLLQVTTGDTYMCDIPDASLAGTSFAVFLSVSDKQSKNNQYVGPR